MKNWKSILVGFAAGIVFMSTTAIAAGTNVSAYVAGDISFKFNGVTTMADPNMPVLNYNDYTYVPTRFVAEKLGCSVSFDPVKRQVVINSPEPEVVEKVVEKEVEKIVYVDKTDDPDYKTYQKLPINSVTDDYEIDITAISRATANDVAITGNTTKVFITLENKGQYNLQINPGSAKLVVDDKEYAPYAFSNQWDREWYNDLKPNEGEDSIKEGYLIFDLIPEDWKNCTLSFELFRNGARTDAVQTLEFNIKK